MDGKLIIIVGHYGSGKTEFAVNYALSISDGSKKTLLTDLDIVNPYFRSAHKKSILDARGIEVISASLGGIADTPALPAETLRALDDTTVNSIIDVGGDPVGAHVLLRYRSILSQRNHEIWMVVNANRPETQDSEKVCNYIASIEHACGQKITGLINNTHLMEYTSADDILRGASLVEECSKLQQLPVIYHCVMSSLFDEVRPLIDGEVFKMEHYMTKPWEEFSV